MDWLYNRKFMAPVLASVATVLTTVLVGIWPDFPFTQDVVLQFLMWIWAAGLGIPAADALYDQSRNLIDLVQASHNKG